MTIYCSWCGKEMGYKKGKGSTPSICDDCAKTFKREMEKNDIKDEHIITKRSHLNTINNP